MSVKLLSSSPRFCPLLPAPWQPSLSSAGQAAREELPSDLPSVNANNCVYPQKDLSV